MLTVSAHLYRRTNYWSDKNWLGKTQNFKQKLLDSVLFFNATTIYHLVWGCKYISTYNDDHHIHDFHEYQTQIRKEVEVYFCYYVLLFLGNDIHVAFGDFKIFSLVYT